MMLLNPHIGVSTWSLNKSIAARTPLLDIPTQVAAHSLSKPALTAPGSAIQGEPL